jgi:putative transposase
MARLARVVAVGVPDHVTQRGNDRQTVFATDLDRTRYMEALRYHCAGFG